MFMAFASASLVVQTTQPGIMLDSGRLVVAWLICGRYWVAALLPAH